MQEINELKNLVIQSLEGNGTLGNIRAQIRASVFKIIELQETNQKKNAGFYWENPQAQTIYDNKEGKIALELINDFLEHFKMEYTLSVFGHESNLKEPAKRETLQKTLGVKGDGTKPVLFSIISALMAGGIVSPNKENLTVPPASTSTTTKQVGTIQQQQQKPVQEDLGKKNFDNFGKSQKVEEPKEVNLQPKGGKLPALSSLSPQGNLSSTNAQTDSFKDPRRAAIDELKKPFPEQKKAGQFPDTKKAEPFQSYGVHKNNEPESDDEYGEEVFENVDEELVEDLEDEDIKNKDRRSMLTSSEDIIGASQSQGFDVSVDSLALEEYDYFENAERKR